MFVQMIFMFKREWLFERRSFARILIASAALFVLSYILTQNNIGKPNIVRILTVPLLAALVFYALNWVFFKIYNRGHPYVLMNNEWRLLTIDEMKGVPILQIGDSMVKTSESTVLEKKRLGGKV